MVKTLAVTTFVALSSFVPAAQASITYNGNFKVLVTDGFYFLQDFTTDFPFEDRYGDLTGKILDLRFSIIQIPAIYNRPKVSAGHGFIGNSEFSITPSTTKYGNFQFARFTGNAHSAEVDLYKEGEYNNHSRNITFSFDGANPESGPVSGSGHAYEYIEDYNPNHEAEAYFKILSGKVTATTSSAVPEPATWTLMVLGIGAVGAIMRSKRRALPAYVARSA